jgi:hypothetical protein
VLKATGVRISMDGRGRWMDNVFIERLWRSLKYECIYLQAFETGSEARVGIGRWVGYYNADRPHSALGGLTPEEAYARPANPSEPVLMSEARLAAWCRSRSTLSKPPNCPANQDQLCRAGSAGRRPRCGRPVCARRRHRSRPLPGAVALARRALSPWPGASAPIPQNQTEVQRPSSWRSLPVRHSESRITPSGKLMSPSHRKLV